MIDAHFFCLSDPFLEMISFHGFMFHGTWCFHWWPLVRKRSRVSPSWLFLYFSLKVDLDNVDEKEFPKVVNLEFLDCILNEGEMLYIPPRWWHYVRSLTTSFSVSFWWSDIANSSASWLEHIILLFTFHITFSCIPNKNTTTQEIYEQRMLLLLHCISCATITNLDSFFWLINIGSSLCKGTYFYQVI